MDKVFAVVASSPFAPVFIFGLVVAAIFAAVWYAQYKRRKDLAAMCLNGGFEFDEAAAGLLSLGAMNASSTPAPPSYSSSSGFAAIGGDPSAAGWNGLPTAGPDPYANDPIYKKSGFFGSLFSYSSSPLTNTGLEIFNAGHSRKATNLVMVPFRRGKIFFFDYRYTVGSGKHSHTYNFTLALMKTSAALPGFYLRPENFGDTMLSWIGFDDIDMPGYPEFSSKYYLKSSSPGSVMSFFNNERINILQAGAAWNLYAGGNYLVVFKKKGKISVADYPTYIEEVKTLVNSLNLE